MHAHAHQHQEECAVLVHLHSVVILIFQQISIEIVRSKYRLRYMCNQFSKLFKCNRFFMQLQKRVPNDSGSCDTRVQNIFQLHFHRFGVRIMKTKITRNLFKSYPFAMFRPVLVLLLLLFLSSSLLLLLLLISVNFSITDVTEDMKREKIVERFQ